MVYDILCVCEACYMYLLIGVHVYPYILCMLVFTIYCIYNIFLCTILYVYRFDEAIDSYHRSLAIQPTSPFTAEMLDHALTDYCHYYPASTVEEEEDGEEEGVEDREMSI